MDLVKELLNGSRLALARAITAVESEYDEAIDIMKAIYPKTGHARILGVTGAPGAGKSTLTDKIVKQYLQQGKKIGIVAVDPTSPFSGGAILGDRIRMNDLTLNENVFIRSMGTRGSLGGLSKKTSDAVKLMDAFGMDLVIIETVGIGQSEVEIASLANVTVVVLVPEAGDEIQTMKAGIMEIADVFVVNKSDRPDADRFLQSLKLMLAPAFSRTQNEIPVLKTIASTHEGVEELASQIKKKLAGSTTERQIKLLAYKAIQLIQKERMKGISEDQIITSIQQSLQQGTFNLYRFVKKMELLNQ